MIVVESVAALVSRTVKTSLDPLQKMPRVRQNPRFAQTNRMEPFADPIDRVDEKPVAGPPRESRKSLGQSVGVAVHGTNDIGRVGQAPRVTYRCFQQDRIDLQYVAQGSGQASSRESTGSWVFS